jgi:hypothetical protein
LSVVERRSEQRLPSLRECLPGPRYTEAMKRRPSEPEPEYGVGTFFTLMMLPLTCVGFGRLLFEFAPGGWRGMGPSLAVIGVLLMLPCLSSCIEIAGKRWAPLGGVLAFLGLGAIYYGVVFNGLRWMSMKL